MVFWSRGPREAVAAPRLPAAAAVPTAPAISAAANRQALTATRWMTEMELDMGGKFTSCFANRNPESPCWFDASAPDFAPPILLPEFPCLRSRSARPGLGIGDFSGIARGGGGRGDR